MQNYFYGCKTISTDAKLCLQVRNLWQCQNRAKMVGPEGCRFDSRPCQITLCPWKALHPTCLGVNAPALTEIRSG